jgi:hypothetical protein
MLMLLSVLFICLKLAGVITWAWWICLLPAGIVVSWFLFWLFIAVLADVKG